MHNLEEIQDLAFKRIPAEAERYVSGSHATAVFVQEALFDYKYDRYRNIDLSDREALMREYPGDVILLPHELDDLRYRAAYHGAGMATEPDDVSPRVVHDHLSNNLENYMPNMEYDRIVLPWCYRFKPGALAAVLRHDFFIAASDVADGHLHRLSLIPEEEPSDISDIDLTVAVASYDDETDGYDYEDYEDDVYMGEPGDYLEEAFLDFKPGVPSEEIVHSAFLRAGYTPPFDQQWLRTMESVVQDMIDGDDRPHTDSVDTL